MRCVKRCTCGSKPQKPSPWHSEKNPVLWLFGDGGYQCRILGEKRVQLRTTLFLLIGLFTVFLNSETDQPTYSIRKMDIHG